MSFDSERQAIVDTAAHLVRSGVLSFSNHGNSSARLPGGDRMLITGASSLAGPTPASLAVLDLEGNLLEGSLASTSAEIVGMHALVYRLRPEVGAVIHTHSPRVTAFALANRPLPVHYEALLRFGVSEEIPVAAWAPRGSPESVANIAAALRERPGAAAVLLANHGLLAFAADQPRTAHLIVSMEEAAQMMLLAQPLGGSRPFPDGALEQVRRRQQAFA